jgi:hypothetical protein
MLTAHVFSTDGANPILQFAMPLKKGKTKNIYLNATPNPALLYGTTC